MNEQDRWTDALDKEMSDLGQVSEADRLADLELELQTKLTKEVVLSAGVSPLRRGFEFTEGNPRVDNVYNPFDVEECRRRIPRRLRPQYF